ncbi:MAG: alkyl sulfatase dimerization domain-containing protein [Desulfovibrionaceae bacterium]|nr:alkyl sulfatase dimerization domain-containing protein [Desulfovibrionaceae bacterium]
MKQTSAYVCSLVAAAFLLQPAHAAAGTTPSVQHPAAVAMPRDATESTRKAQDAIRAELPFTDRRDFEDAHRGFIAADNPMIFRGKNGNVVWDMDSYRRFIDENRAAPDTVNPSLWRMAQLNMIHGLFKVSDDIYQVRGYDISNITFIRGRTGWIVFDPLISVEMAEAALKLVNEKLGKRPVVAVLYSHSHIDHYGGVRGVIDEADVKAGKVQVIAPRGFMQHAVSENVIAGNAMGRRASYMYGVLLPRNAKGSVGSGLGMTNSMGTRSLIPPTIEITETGQTLNIDGVRMVFQMTPGTEAPAEMNTWFPDFKALWMAENVCNTMHNILTLRGAQVRDPLVWSRYINEALETWGDQAEIRFQAHHWPRWGNGRIQEELIAQRDLYKFIHDQSVRLMNQGYVGAEIAERLTLPPSLAREWANRGYYGSLKHNSRAVYQRYMGWYSGHPSDLDSLPPEDAARKYVEYMGGTEAILARARQSFARGEYRWVAEVLKHAVFADPANKAARELLADALEQLGYQAESGPWRNVYLQGAYELRHGLPQVMASAGGSADSLRAMTPEMIFDYLGVLLNPEKLDARPLAVRVTLTDLRKAYTLTAGNGVLQYSARRMPAPDVSVSGPAAVVLPLLMGKLPAEQADRLQQRKTLVLDGDTPRLKTLIAAFEMPPRVFPIVTP